MDKLRPKYCVARLREDGGEPDPLPDSTNPLNQEAPFVLIPGKDPAAFHAMLAYAEWCEPDLADEIYEWLESILEAMPQLGTQGRRNLAAELKRALGWPGPRSAPRPG